MSRRGGSRQCERQREKRNKFLGGHGRFAVVSYEARAEPIAT
jgi:hypothetical protein